MGDLRVFCYPQSANIMEDRLYTTASVFAPAPNPDPSSIRAEIWGVAEETTREVVNCIHPTLDSEEKRKDVIDYIQRLIRGSLGCEVAIISPIFFSLYLHSCLYICIIWYMPHRLYVFCSVFLYYVAKLSVLRY